LTVSQNKLITQEAKRLLEQVYIADKLLNYLAFQSTERIKVSCSFRNTNIHCH